MLLTCLHENLLTRLVRVCLVDQQKQILDYLLKLLVKKSVTYCAKAFNFWLTFNVIAKYLNFKLTFNVIVPSLLMSKTRNICLRFSSEKVSLIRERFFCINYLFRFLYSVSSLSPGEPLDMIYRTIMNSRKSMWPSWRFTMRLFYPLFTFSSLIFFVLSRK